MPRCKLCNKSYRTKGSLRSHYYDNHDGKNERVIRIECPLEGCAASFETRTGFNYHCKKHAEAWEHQRQSALSGWTYISMGLARETGKFTHDKEDEEEFNHPSDLFSTLDKSWVEADMLAQSPLHDRKALMESTLDSDVDFVRARLAVFAESFTPANDVALNEYFSSLWKQSPTSMPSSQYAPTFSPPSTPEDILVHDPEHSCLETMLYQVRDRLNVSTDPELEVIYRILFQDDLD